MSEQKPVSKEELSEMAAQLRKPGGENGLQAGEFMNQGNGAMNLHTLAVLNPQEEDIILELGMGNGFFVKNIVSLSEDITYVGVDYSELMVDEAIRINEELGLEDRVEFIHGDIKDLPLEDASFTKVFSVNTFYFWDDHLSAVKEIRRVLELGGEFILAVRPKHLMLKFPVTEFNFAIWEESDIIDLFMQNGFSTVEKTAVVEPKIEALGQTFATESVMLKFR